MSKVAVKFITNMVYILQRVMLFMIFNATLVIYANNVKPIWYAISAERRRRNVIIL
jgi:type IV secretory pathway TrbL component